MNKILIALASTSLLVLTSCGAKDTQPATPVVQIENPRPGTGGQVATNKAQVTGAKTTVQKKTTSTSAKKYVAKKSSTLSVKSDEGTGYVYTPTTPYYGYKYTYGEPTGSYFYPSTFAAGFAKYNNQYGYSYNNSYGYNYGTPYYNTPQYFPSAPVQPTSLSTNHYMASYNAAVQLGK